MRLVNGEQFELRRCLLLGRGKRFFSDSADPRELALVSTKATPTGVLMNTYRHVGALRTE